MARSLANVHKHHVRKVASKRFTMARLEKDRAERDAKARHVEALRAAREARA